MSEVNLNQGGEQKQPQQIVIDIAPGGEIEIEWWTPQVGDLACGVCGRCPGWRSPKVDRTCVAGNKWCG
jgi:hypothetical protein